MKVFLSWSGEASKAIASVFADWLPTLPLRIEVFFSASDIGSGERWSKLIDETLEASSFGILFMTKDNTAAPWIMFEAGALAKQVESSRVCPILFGIKPSDLQGPLSKFQARNFQREQILQLLEDMNTESGPGAIPAAALHKAFDRAWEELETAVGKELASKSAKSHTQTPQQEPIEQVLALTRNVSSSMDIILRELRRLSRQSPNPSRPRVYRASDTSVRNFLIKSPSGQMVEFQTQPGGKLPNDEDLRTIFEEEGPYEFIET